MTRDPEKTVRTVTVLAAVLAVFVGLSVPAAYFTGEYSHRKSALETEVEIQADLVGSLIITNPDLWMFDEHRLHEILNRRPEKARFETRRIIDARNRVVVQIGGSPVPPVISRSVNFFDSGNVIGRIEITRSLRPLLIETALVALFGALLGLAVFLVLKVLPLAALRRALSALSAEREQALVTLRSIGEGVIVVDSSGRVESINEMAETLTGLKEAEARGRPLQEVFRIVDGKTRAPCRIPLENPGQAPAAKKDWTHADPVVLIGGDGVERLIEGRPAPILDRDGNSAGAVLAFRDVTEKVRTEQHHLTGMKLESLGILAGGIAHDFNNFLAGILGNVSLAKLSVEADHPASERLAAAEKAGARAKELASKLLTFSKGGAPVRKPVSMEEIVKDSAHLALMGSACRCEFDFPEGMWAAIADAGQMGQVVSNLVINAIQAMPGGGTIRIRGENAAIREDGIPHVKPGDYVRIDVLDHGIGIPNENLGKIFDPFFTTKEKGSGMGLATSYTILKSHGGNIFADSAPAAGTTFRLYVPASRVCVPETRKKREGAAAVRGKGRILVMDDEEMILDVARGMLAHLGYEPAVARDGSDAVSAYLKARDAGEPFEAVIMDLTIPGGMGGEEAVRKLLNRAPDAKAIVSSGYSNDPVMAAHAAYGFRGVVVKPYRIEELSRVLREVISGEAEVRARTG
jgi:PAS domain S-box-containing protein